MTDIGKLGGHLNILMGAQHLTVLKAGYNTHRSWFRRFMSTWGYIPYENWTVAYFTEPGRARDYIDWAADTGPRPHGHRFRTDSVLAGFERAWVEPFFTRLPIDPPQSDPAIHQKTGLRLVTEDNN